jgi:hypothetical protein
MHGANFKYCPNPTDDGSVKTCKQTKAKLCYSLSNIAGIEVVYAEGSQKHTE